MDHLEHRTETMNKTTQRGIAALKRGDKSRARELLRQAVEENPEDIQAWLWLSGAVETDQERITCLQRVLELDPDHEAALRGLAKLLSEGSVSLQARTEPAPRPDGVTEPPSPPTPWAAARATRSEAEPQPEMGTQHGTRERYFTVRPSVVPVLIGTFLGGLIFAPLLIYLNVVLDAESFAAGIFNFLLVIMVVGFGVRVFFIFLGRLFTKYSLTSDHLIVERGILSRSEKTIPIRRIQDVATKQSVIERPFGIGDVMVQSAGERGAAVLDDLPRCRHYSDVIVRAVEEQEAGQSGP